MGTQVSYKKRVYCPFNDKSICYYLPPTWICENIKFISFLFQGVCRYTTTMGMWRIGFHTLITPSPPPSPQINVPNWPWPPTIITHPLLVFTQGGPGLSFQQQSCDPYYYYYFYHFRGLLFIRAETWPCL